MECQPGLRCRSPVVTERVTTSTTGEQIWEVIDGHSSASAIEKFEMQIVVLCWPLHSPVIGSTATPRVFAPSLSTSPQHLPEHTGAGARVRDSG